MRDYPPDILPLYAQGFSVAKYLIMEKGRKHFLDYVNAGMELERPGHELEAWNLATRQYYGFQDLSELQVKWERWVAEGSQEKEIPDNASSRRLAAASIERPNAEAPARRVDISTAGKQAVANNEFAQGSNNPRGSQSSTGNQSSGRLASLNEGWYAKQMKVGRRYRPQAEKAEKTKPVAPPTESRTILR